MNPDPAALIAADRIQNEKGGSAHATVEAPRRPKPVPTPAKKPRNATASKQPLRFERVNVCKECPVKGCGGSVCEPARQPLRTYTGVRFTSDGFDCALPVAIDSFSHCSYGCLYCFSDNLIQHRVGANRPPGVTDLGVIERVFGGDMGRLGDQLRTALRYDRRNAQGYPCAVQLGAINDPCDHIERQQGWLLRYIDLAIKYRQPTRISTKGTVFQLPEYLDAVARAPELFWVAFSIISIDDDIMAHVDRRAPVPSERLATMKALSSVGVTTSLRFRPIMPGLSDRTARYPYAWRDLIDAAYEAGARVVSYEVAFVPGSASPDVKRRWDELSDLAGVPFHDLYSKFGPMGSCTRPSYGWTEDIMHKVRDHAHRLGMVVGVSDPVWKQLTDSGNCCGMMPDDPVFGNWQTESATNQLLLARDTGKILSAGDIIPQWAYSARLADICNPGVGPKAVWGARHSTWADRLRQTWNDLKSARGPLGYFQGALMPVSRDANGDVQYKYVGLERAHRRVVPFWNAEG